MTVRRKPNLRRYSDVMKLLRNIIMMLLLLTPALALKAQQDSSVVRITGSAYDPTDPHAFMYLMVVNSRTHQGVFGDPYGGFDIQVKRTDTVLVSARGYQIARICVADSTVKSTYKLEVPMKALEVNLAEVQVFPERPLEDIQEDFETIEDELDALQPLGGMDAVSSPITALYMRFSKIEKSKRKVAELELEDRKRELLKEMFRKYIKFDIIDLSEEEFDDFIVFLNLPVEFIANAPAYDLIMEIKRRYEIFSSIR